MGIARPLRETREATGALKYYTEVGDREWEFTFEHRGEELLATTGDRTYRLDLSMVGDGTAFSLLVDGRSYDLIVESADGGSMVLVGGEQVAVRVADERERTAQQVAGARDTGKGAVTSSMPGVVVSVLVGEGDEVEHGQTLLILEAMKMQNPIQAESAGVVARVHVREGDAVRNGAKLLDLE